MFCGKDERGKGDDDDDDTSALLSAASSTVSAVVPPAGAGKGAIPVNAQSRAKAPWNPANPAEANPLIGALTFETPTHAMAAPWSQTLANFPASPTISTPGIPTWFALSQVPMPAPVAAGPADAKAAGAKGRGLEGEHQSADKCSDRTASKRPKLDIPDQGFHQARATRALRVRTPGPNVRPPLSAVPARRSSRAAAPPLPARVLNAPSRLGRHIRHEFGLSQTWNNLCSRARGTVPVLFDARRS